MKKYFPSFLPAIFISTFSCFFIGCIKDTCHQTHTYSYYVPVYKTTEEVKTNIKSNPAKEVQNPGKIFTLGNYIFLNEIDKGIHVIDNSNPSSPKNAAFIDIPGNLDLAVKGNTLYADAYTDLVTIDITNPLNVIVKKYNENIFPYRSYNNVFAGDATKVIVDWQKRDTTVTETCEETSWVTSNPGIFYSASQSKDASASNVSVSPIGQGGSMATFALIGNYLYTVDFSDLTVFNITNSVDPIFSNKVPVDLHVETIYPFKNKLFIGSNIGMYIYNVASSPSDPKREGEFTHVRACDPVIADDNFAYVTLHSGTPCLGFDNELDVVKLNNFVDAALVKTYNFTSPQGLSKDGDILFVCDGSAGLKVFNAADPMNLQQIKEFSNLETYDVIANSNIALVVATDGLYQYDYSNINDIHLLSKISILK